jgi:hypothetical protein
MLEVAPELEVVVLVPTRLGGRERGRIVEDIVIQLHPSIVKRGSSTGIHHSTRGKRRMARNEGKSATERCSWSAVGGDTPKIKPSLPVGNSGSVSINSTDERSCGLLDSDKEKKELRRIWI